MVQPEKMIMKIPTYNELGEGEVKELLECITQQSSNARLTHRVVLTLTGVNMLFDKRRIFVSCEAEHSFFVMVYPYEVSVKRNVMTITDKTGVGIQFETPAYMSEAEVKALLEGKAQ